MAWRRWIHAVPARLRAVLRPRRIEQDVDDELAFHLEMQARAHRERGMHETEARRRARIDLGGIEQVKERSRDVRPLRLWHDLAQDVRYALRTLWKTPRFSIAALLTVVLGVGANATIFSVLNPLLFKPLPYPQPERIVNVFRTSPQSQRWPHSYANYLDHRQRNHEFEQLAAMTWADATLAEANQPAERLFSIRASGNYFAMLGVGPLLGRTFTDADDQPGAEPVIVLSYRFWQRRFAGDPAIIGRSVRIDGRAMAVIGVMPPDFEYPLFWGNVDIWRPFAYPVERRNDRGNNFLREFARLKPGVSFEQADASIKAIAAQILTEHPELDQRESMRLEALSVASPTMRRVSAFAFGLSFLVLLIACVNLANLQLARTTTRAREFAIRGAIGGGTARLLRQSLTESLLLSLVGGLVAIPLSFWCTQIIATRQFSDLPGVRISMDPVNLAFAFACAAATGIIFGAVPAWLAARTDVNAVLTQHPRSTSAGGASNRFRHALIVAEIAFALITLVGAASFLRSLQLITGVDPGWRTDDVIAARISLITPNYIQPRARVDFWDALLARATELPGITSVALAASSVPVSSFNNSTTFVAEGRTELLLAYNERVTPGYFETLGIPLLRGRIFTRDDRFDRAPVMIVNESMARALWPNEDPIGKRLSYADPKPVWREVVGVVRNVTFPFAATSGTVDTDFQVYQPVSQDVPAVAGILLRTSGLPDAVAPGLKRIVASLDRDVAVVGLSTARTARERTTASFQLLASVLGAFAGLGVALAAVGIFGVVSYTTAQRSGEIGLRMALGARQREVLWLVLKQGVILTCVGALIGLAGGIGLGRVLAASIPRLPAPEIALVAGTTVTMIVVAVTAMYIPARRASKTSPMLVLRHE